MVGWGGGDLGEEEGGNMKNNSMMMESCVSVGNQGNVRLAILWPIDSGLGPFRRFKHIQTPHFSLGEN